MILVTGAAGLIGRALVNQLLKDKQGVRAHARSIAALGQAARSWHADSQRLELEQGDLVSAGHEELSALCSGCTTVVHCAALVHKPDSQAEEYSTANVKVTKALAQAAKASGVAKFVFLSTSAVYGEGPFESVNEDIPTSPQTPYAESKRQCERILAEVMPAATTIILRPGLVFGEGDRGNMRSLIKQIKKGLYFNIAGNRAMKSVIYSSDLALAITAALARLSPGYHVLNAANPQPIGVADLGDIIAAACDCSPPPVVPQPLIKTAAVACQAFMGKRAILSISKMQKLMTTTTLDINALVISTGFSPPTPLVEALKSEAAWLSEGH
jgi:UDP-glucose 4-epimerase